MPGIGMTISLPGLLNRAAEAADAGEPELEYGFMLRQLLDHLRELRTRHSDGDAGFMGIK